MVRGHGGDEDGRRDAEVDRVADVDSHGALAGNPVDVRHADAYAEDRSGHRDQAGAGGDPEEPPGPWVSASSDSARSLAGTWSARGVYTPA